MNRIKSTGLFLLLFLLVSSAVDNRGVKNFHKVNEDLFRSGQPNARAMQQFEASAIRSILNLRNSFGDQHEIKRTGLIQIHLPMKAKKMNVTDVINALRAIKNAEKPVLVHCYHGSDRTGCVVAAYRMVFESWSKEKAIAEFRQDEYGYNFKLFPNLLTLLQELDIEKVKKEVFSE